ncbi:MAG: DUF4908 domain-containing protein [Caulobacterales bacterium]
MQNCNLSLEGLTTEDGDMRLVPGAVDLLPKSASGVALALFVASAPASAQQASAAPLAREACPSAAATPLSPLALSECFYQASIRTSRAARHVVSFETRTDANPETAPSFADAVTVTSEALVNVAGRPGGTSALARIHNVVIARGADPSARLSDGVLTVTIVPSRGVAGRPSTGQIERAAGTP